MYTVHLSTSLFYRSLLHISLPAGVGDLYTDPQMHTVDQREYGEANLGTKGMALFFSSHICNPICAAMGESCVEVVLVVSYLLIICVK